MGVRSSAAIEFHFRAHRNIVMLIKIIAHRKACTKYSIVLIAALILINILPQVLTEALVSLSHN